MIDEDERKKAWCGVAAPQTFTQGVDPASTSINTANPTSTSKNTKGAEEGSYVPQHPDHPSPPSQYLPLSK